MLSKGEIVALSVGGACSILGIVTTIYLLYLYRKRRKQPQLDSEYAKILPASNAASFSSLYQQTAITPNPHEKHHEPNGGSNAMTPVSMRTIPFTVPTAGSPLSAPIGGPMARVHDDSGSTGSTSEPSSPSLCSVRGSTDNLATSYPSDFRGAYSLGSIDPSLYKLGDEDDNYLIPEGHIGRVWFAVEYERESEKLLLTLIKCKNLPSRVMGSINGCDPFVRIFLMPDERRYLQSKFKKKTCNPTYEESFVFQVSNKSLDERMLKLTVYDVDRHKRHQVVGHAFYCLKVHDIDSNERVVIWRDLEREAIEMKGRRFPKDMPICIHKLIQPTLDKAEMHIALTYNNHLERLTVGVFEGKTFKRADLPIDSYIKISLLVQNKVVKSKKTDVSKRNSQPQFNESFTFKLPSNSLDSASVNVVAMQHLSGQRDKPIGRVVFGSFMFARGKELEHWNEMVANQREQVSQWHTLS